VIERLVSGGAAQYGDCAIMYRTNAQSRPFEEALARRRIPYTLVGGVRFYERREIKDMLAWLRLLYNPNDDVSLVRVCEEYAEGVGAGSLAHVTTWASAQHCSLFAALVRVATESDALPQLKGVSRQRVLRFAAQLHHLMQSATTTPLVDVFAQVMVEINMADHFERQYGRDEARLRLENINELQRVAGEYAELPVDLQLGQFLEEVALVADVDVLDKQAAHKGQVICITMHQAKGLEYDNVFLVGLEDNIIPHVRTHLDAQQVEEERRILYVGMTRARKRLYLMRALRRAVFGNSEPTKRSRFLADIPMEQLTVLTNNGTVAPRPARATPNPAYQGWGNAAAFQQPKSAPMLEFSVGDHVRHQRFGEGIVLAAKVVDDDVEVVVRFADRAVGEKKLIASFARLQKITLPEDPS